MAEMRIALAAIAAIVGAGFASGREIASFFTAHGRWWGLGVVLCCAATGLIVAMLVRLARRTGSTSLGQLYSRVMDERCGESVQVVCAMLLLTVCAAMCSAAAEMGALALSGWFARPAGTACAVAAALLGAKDGKKLAASGAAAAAIIFAFYLVICMRAEGQWARSPQDGLMVSGCLGVLYACLNTALAAGVICAQGQRAASPARAGLFTGILLFCLLMPACMAVGRLGKTDMALPSVMLAGEMGAFGFWMSLAALFAAAISTLATCFFSLKEIFGQAGLPEKFCMPAAVIAPLMLSAVGFSPIVDVGYPLLGFLCAMLLPALALFLNDDG